MQFAIPSVPNNLGIFPAFDLACRAFVITIPVNCPLNIAQNEHQLRRPMFTQYPNV